MFTHPFPHAFGIDIGDRSIKLVQLRHIGKLRAVTFKPIIMRSIELPPGLVQKGIIEQPEAVRIAVRQLLEGTTKHETPVKSPWVVASVPENHSFTKLISLPSKDMENLERPEIMAYLSKYLPINDLKLYNMDWHVVQYETDGDTVHILLGAIAKSIADNYTYLLESLGLGVIALEIEEVAIARTMITAQKDYANEARVVIDIGSHRTQVIIYDNDVIQFSALLPFSGDILDQVLAQVTQGDTTLIEKMKKEIGLDASKNPQVSSLLLSEVKKFAEELKQTFTSHYRHNKNSNKITRIIMCGGVCNLPLLDTALSNLLDIECVRGNVWKNLGINPRRTPVGNEVALSYATAIGLALRAADNPFFSNENL